MENKRTYFPDPDLRMTNKLLDISRTVSELQNRGFFKAQSMLYELIHTLFNSTALEGFDHALPFDTAMTTFLRDHQYTKLTNADIAHHFKMSIPALYKKCGDTTPQKRLLEIRLETAKDKLLMGQSSKLVAAELQFFDKSHFSNVFKKRFGVSPGKFDR